MGLLAVALASACASPPPQPPRTHASAAGAEHSGDSPQFDADAAMRKRGYKPAIYRGERVYCRNEMITGSNLQSRVCLTARQIADQERAGKDIVSGNHPAACPPNTNC